MKQIVRYMLVTLALFLPTMLSADSNDDTSVINSDSQQTDDNVTQDRQDDRTAWQFQCRQFDGYPRQCYSVRGCTYDRFRNICVANGGGGGGWPGGGRVFWVCQAQDSGWEEHWNGHQGSGFDYSSAYYGALNECQRYHGRCTVTRCSQSNR